MSRPRPRAAGFWSRSLSGKGISTKIGAVGLILPILILGACGCAPAAPETDEIGEDSNPPTTRDSDPPNSESVSSPSSPRPTSLPPGKSTGAVEASPGEIVQQLSIQVLASYPHDPTAFTQGLQWHDGELFESTGLYGKSSIRRTLPETGEILVRHNLERHLFTEGLTLVDGKLVLLTWKAGLALVFDPETLNPIDEWGYNGEGWGLTFDGRQLIMSDGSPRITFRDREDFRWLRTVEVTLEGRPLPRINELEYVDGQIYANVWGEERIVRLDPETGRVNAVIRASGLLKPEESRLVDVLNGIAYDADSETFWLTGKFWPLMFQVKFVPADD